MVGRQVSMIKQDYGEIGQSLIDKITDTLRTRNAASLLYIAEQKCFQITGFSETQRGECVEILSRAQSSAYHLRINEETDQDIIRFQLIPILRESDLDRTAYDFARSGQNFIQGQRDSRSRSAIRTRLERLRKERQLSPRNL